MARKPNPVIEHLIKEGVEAPDFTAQTDGGGSISLSSLKGKQVVLYFYPKDDTPGCTNEAIDFSKHLDDFKDVNAVVIGVSRDSIESHDRFKTKHRINFPLIADTDATICKAYEVWKEKSMFGKKYMGIERSTFLINPNGTIEHVWRKVSVTRHIRKVLDCAITVSHQTENC